MRRLGIEHNMFENFHEEQSCYDIIVEYSRGGKDHGLTERYMRRACSLQAAPATENQSMLAGVVVETEANQFLLKEPAQASQKEREFAVALLRETCDRRLEGMTMTYFNQRARRVEGSCKTRQQLWDDLAAIWTLESPDSQGATQGR